MSDPVTGRSASGSGEVREPQRDGTLRRGTDPARRRRIERAVVTALVIADLALALLVSGRYFFRADLSRNAAYTLSAASKSVLAALPERVTITYYVSDLLRNRYPFPSEVEDLLAEYAGWSGGRISITSEDPSKSRRPLNLAALGVSGQQMQVVQRDQVNLATVYSGIVLQYLDRSSTIGFVSDLSTLEYDLTSRIRALVANRKDTLGLLVGDARKSLSQDYGLLARSLAAQYQIQEVQRGGSIPPEVSVLFVLGTRDIDPPSMLAIDQYLMGGGKALFAVDPVDVDLGGGLAATVNKNQAVESALAAYGVVVRPQLVLDVLNQRLSFSTGQGSYRIINYPHWITISGKDVDQTQPVTARFAGLDLYWPSPLELQSRPGVRGLALVRTSADAWVQTARFSTNPMLPDTLQAPDSVDRAQYTVAAILSGTLPSAFAGQPLPTRPGEKPAPGPRFLASSAPTRLIVVGNAGFASNMIQYTQAEYNLTFLSNCADWLLQQEDLLGIKTRAQVDTRLDAIRDPLAKANVMRTAIVINVGLVPALIAAYGFVRLILRRRAKHLQPGRPA
ncbi:MAG TPA: GldG family protein [Spirochaetia bacterium]|nr:GldG family protein [Spirochaetia bacterium]